MEVYDLRHNKSNYLHIINYICFPLTCKAPSISFFLANIDQYSNFLKKLLKLYRPENSKTKRVKIFKDFSTNTHLAKIRFYVIFYFLKHAKYT